MAVPGGPPAIAAEAADASAAAHPASIEHPAARVLAQFLDSIRVADYASAYALVASSAKTGGDATLAGIRVSKEVFLTEVQFDEERIAELRTAVSAERESKRQTGGGVLPSSPWTPPGQAELLLQERNRRRNLKCGNASIEGVAQVAPGRAEVHLTTAIEGVLVDRDTAVLVWEGSGWLVANPLHIIR